VWYYFVGDGYDPTTLQQNSVSGGIVHLDQGTPVLMYGSVTQYNALVPGSITQQSTDQILGRPVQYDTTTTINFVRYAHLAARLPRDRGRPACGSTPFVVV
jgi:hypothetical protein